MGSAFNPILFNENPHSLATVANFMTRWSSTGMSGFDNKRLSLADCFVLFLTNVRQKNDINQLLTSHTISNFHIKHQYLHVVLLQTT